MDKALAANATADADCSHHCFAMPAVGYWWVAPACAATSEGTQLLT
jgi:hypothetical protein